MSSYPDSDGDDDRVRIGWQPDAAKLRGPDAPTGQARARSSCVFLLRISRSRACSRRTRQGVVRPALRGDMSARPLRCAALRLDVKQG